MTEERFGHGPRFTALHSQTSLGVGRVVVLLCSHWKLNLWFLSALKLGFLITKNLLWVHLQQEREKAVAAVHCRIVHDAHYACWTCHEMTVHVADRVEYLYLRVSVCLELWPPFTHPPSTQTPTLTLGHSVCLFVSVTLWSACSSPLVSWTKRGK